VVAGGGVTGAAATARRLERAMLATARRLERAMLATARRLERAMLARVLWPSGPRNQHLRLVARSML
jgi:hypothetical protein